MSRSTDPAASSVRAGGWRGCRSIVLTIFSTICRSWACPRVDQIPQDVSEEFRRFGARITNKKRLEERILKLIDERTGNIKEITDMEEQLSRVREEIERECVKRAI